MLNILFASALIGAALCAGITLAIAPLPPAPAMPRLSRHKRNRRARVIARAHFATSLADVQPIGPYAPRERIRERTLNRLLTREAARIAFGE